ncbi:hypothetical protein [Mucilaginibacter paludis]|uniref:Outer membrane protein beta-barrel domain-containing protein n=1 Tax=Mucilaginibacter paludis DSM 18603 TaxID=714943 RepID=H1Y0T1_9SPHI|nr:hypothetical protein [Mucilaginibacter paludis]EHQ28821.1 hypothetical protein Mucpa_4736 [Mucilaginibacter paludis DSM 18603]
MTISLTFIKFTRSCLLSLTFIFLFNAVYSQQAASVYPRIIGYFSIYHPIETLSSGNFTGNFGNTYTVSFPLGIQILKSDHVGVSLEIAPTVRTENNISKVSSLSFCPGAFLRLPHNANVVARLAFESTGRFGFTPSVNKVLVKGKDCSLFGSIPFPVRFGNNQATSIGGGLQLGVLF